jgi:hypothetical protein
MLRAVESMGVNPGAGEETPDTPDELDAVVWWGGGLAMGSSSVAGWTNVLILRMNY